MAPNNKWGEHANYQHAHPFQGMEEIFSFNSSTETAVCVSSSYGMKLRRKAHVATGPRNLLRGIIIILEGGRKVW